MRLALTRQLSTRFGIFGELCREDWTPQCYTLEDPKLAIPLGSYELAITFSERFRRPMPLLLNVPGRNGIRIHAGNTDADTTGCILVGNGQNETGLTNSRLAYIDLFYAIQKALKEEKVWITLIQKGE